MKIGLGAAISGLATYLVTIAKYNNENQKDKRDKTILLLEDSVFKIEKVNSLLSSGSHQFWKFVMTSDATIFEDASKKQWFFW